MPRLRFDLKPIEPWWARDAETQAEYDAGVREFWARHYPGQKPVPCDCGLYAGGPHLSHCGPGAARERCHRDVLKRLESMARHEHLRGLKAKRVFPGVPYPKAGRGRCKWCNGAIVHGRAKTREWHDGREDEPACLGDYYLHTRLESQQPHLLARDGWGCKLCGVVKGRYTPIWTDPTQERVARTWAERAWIRERFAERPAGPLTYTAWNTGHEVDHFIPLSVAWEAFGDQPARFRWFFSPANLRLLCGTCHKAKTRTDIALVRLCQARDPEWSRSEVLRRLSDAGLLRAARPKEAP